MAHIDILTDDLSLDEPMLVEGLPGVGLVGKIAADHLVDEFDMVHYANVHCDGIPRVAVYADDDAELRTPVRIYADEERNLLVLQSDVPIHPQAATEFATCIRSWFEEDGVVPIFLSGIGEEKSGDVPALYGVATGDGGALLEQAGIGRPAVPRPRSGTGRHQRRNRAAHRYRVPHRRPRRPRRGDSRGETATRTTDAGGRRGEYTGPATSNVPVTIDTSIYRNSSIFV
jgi:hypothetical protein